MRLKKFFLLGLPALLLTPVMAFAMPENGGLGLQEPVTPVMEDIVWFHDKLLLPIIIGIVILVMALMLFIMFRFNEKANPNPSKTSHNTLLEIVWTIVPVLILLSLVVPSMKLLYLQDALPETEMTIKATGNTWNWEYAYPDFEDSVDSFISNPLDKDQAAAAGKPYLFASDAPLVVPSGTKVKVLVTSNTNLHAFAVPAFGVKIDAIPGIINETWFEVFEGKEGTYYGQCSELCGVNHYYMPIEVKVVTKDQFNSWVANGGAFKRSVADNMTDMNSGSAVTTAAAQK